MFEMAQQEYNIDKSHSYMIGDKRIDVQAGHKFGICSILVGTGYGREEREKSRSLGEEPFYDLYSETLNGSSGIYYQKGM